MRISDWSSDVCSSDLARELADRQLPTPDRAQDVAGPQVLVMGLELERAKPLAVAAADELLRLRHTHPSVRQAADRLLGGDPLNGLLVQVFSEVLRRARSDERHVGKECVRKFRSRWAPVHLTKTSNTYTISITNTNKNT